MQTSLNNFFNKNKKKISLEDKFIRNKDHSNVIENKVNNKDEKERAEELLKCFDLDPKYGPCRGITRMKRYLNAVRLNLNPSIEVKNMIEKYDLNTSFYDKYI